MGRVIKVKKGNTTYQIKLYDTESGAGTPGTTTGTLKLRMGGANHYARITQHLGSDAAGGATPLRYKKADGTVYQVTQKGEFSITVPASSGQTICVSANGQTYRGANTLWFPEGTTWTAWVEADNSHIAGSLNLTGGTLNSTVTLSVTPATEIPSGSQSYECDYRYGIGSSGTVNVGTFTVPNGIHVLHVVGESGKASYSPTNHTYNIKVTPGKPYSITGHRRRSKIGGTYRTYVTISFNGLEITENIDYRAKISVNWSSTINGYGTDHDFS